MGATARRAIRRERRNTIARIEIFLAAWREKVGVGRGGETLAPADLLRRFDDLLAGVADLARDVKRPGRTRGRAAPGRGRLTWT